MPYLCHRTQNHTTGTPDAARNIYINTRPLPSLMADLDHGWSSVYDRLDKIVSAACVRITLRLSCGARAPQRLRHRPPARRQLQPVVRRRADHEKAGPQGPLRKPGAAMMQSVRSQAKYGHSTEPDLGVGRILSPQARPTSPARMPGSEADHPCAQPRTNRRTQAQRERCRPMTQSRHSIAIEPVSHPSLGNSDTAQPSTPRKQEGKRESAFMTPSSGNSSAFLASRLDQNAC